MQMIYKGQIASCLTHEFPLFDICHHHIDSRFFLKHLQLKLNLTCPDIHIYYLFVFFTLIL